MKKNWDVLQKYYLASIEKFGYSLAEQWIIKSEILKDFGVGRDKNSWTIPMFDSDFKICGIQKRYDDGTKKMVRGTRSGLFISNRFKNLRVAPKGLVICEGFSDTAIAANLGYTAIGRASCSQGVGFLVNILSKCETKYVKLIQDNDYAGEMGTKLLEKSLTKEGVECIIVKMPDGIKDLRELYSKVGWSDCFNIIFQK